MDDFENFLSLLKAVSKDKNAECPFCGGFSWTAIENAFGIESDPPGKYLRVYALRCSICGFVYWFDPDVVRGS